MLPRIVSGNVLSCNSRRVEFFAFAPNSFPTTRFPPPTHVFNVRIWTAPTHASFFGIHVVNTNFTLRCRIYWHPVLLRTFLHCGGSRFKGASDSIFPLVTAHFNFSIFCSSDFTAAIRGCGSIHHNFGLRCHQAKLQGSRRLRISPPDSYLISILELSLSVPLPKKQPYS
jgi:hypothetical protein